MTPKSEWTARAKAVRTAKSEKFTDLIDLSGLRPGRDLSGLDWSGVDFSGCDISSYDLRGSYLHGCTFDGARIAGCFLEGAELGRVLHDPERSPHLPALTTPVANLRRAVDWAEMLQGYALRGAMFTERDACLRTGSIFQDAPFAPEMVVVPSGSFMMGTTSEEAEALVARYGKDYRRLVDREQPRREVSIAHRLAVGRFPVTFEEWDVCFDDNGTKHKPKTEWERGRHPVMRVSWDDITKGYLPWLNKRLGLSGAQAYRLLSESEWEYCCRAGTETAFSCGGTITKYQAQFSAGSIGSANQTVEVGSFPSNAWGLHDMHGNVWEWCQDVFHDSYKDAPDNGTAREDKPREGAVSRVLRGGSWDIIPQYLRSALRNAYLPVARSNVIGFRLARTLNP